MYTSVTLSSYQLYRYLETFPDTGTVHSVYRKTINLCFGDRIAAIQCAGSPASSVSLLTDLSDAQIQNCAITPGMRVFLKKESADLRICIEDRLSLLLSKTALKDFSLHVAEPNPDLVKLLSKCTLALSMHQHESFDTILTHKEAFHSSSLLLNAMHRNLIEISSAYQTQDYETTAVLLCRLVGLGSGLTPAGDDFLCGVLAACMLCPTAPSAFVSLFYSKLSEKLQHHTDCTNMISRTFLISALEGCFSDAILQLPLIPSKERIAADFSAIGHSSGYDTLSGIVFMLNQFLNGF